MKNLLLLLFLLGSLNIQAQQLSHYKYPDTKVIHLTDYQPPIEQYTLPKDYWQFYESRQLIYSGIAFTGMTGLALYFNTLGDGPYIPFAMVTGTAAVGKFIHAGILRKREKGYDEWGRRLR